MAIKQIFKWAMRIVAIVALTAGFASCEKDEVKEDGGEEQKKQEGGEQTPEGLVPAKLKVEYYSIMDEQSVMLLVDWDELENAKEANYLKVPSTVVIENRTYTVASVSVDVSKREGYEYGSVRMDFPNTLKWLQVWGERYDIENLLCNLPSSLDSLNICGNDNITSIEIPNSVSSFFMLACDKLTNIKIPNSLKRLGVEYCGSLTSVDIPSSVTELYFSGCSSLTSVEILGSVTKIGEDTFLDCSSLTSVEIPSSVTEIGKDAFSGCSSLTSLEIPSSVTEIEYRAFSGCDNLKSVRVPKGCSVGDWAFPDGCEVIYY